MASIRTTVLHGTVILLADLLLGYFNTNKVGPRHRYWQWSTIICSVLTASLLHGFGSCQVELSRQHPGRAQETPDAKDCFQVTIWTWTSCFEDKRSKLEHMEVIHCHAAWTQIPGQINSVPQKLLSSPVPKGWALQMGDQECPLQQ